MSNNGHKDVRIVVPSATYFARNPFPGGSVPAVPSVPSPDELVAMQQQEIRRLTTELEQLRITANTIANTTVALVYMLQEDRGSNGSKPNEIRIPRALRFRLDGCSVTVRSDSDDTFVSYSERIGEHSFDGRADG